MRELTAPSEGAAGTPTEIADELCDALIAFDHIDYNAVTVGELSELLEARETIEEICLRYRGQQESRGPRSDDSEGDTDR